MHPQYEYQNPASLCAQLITHFNLTSNLKVTTTWLQVEYAAVVKGY